MASGWPVTTMWGPTCTDTCCGSWGSAGVTSQPARSIARSTTGSRALPASSTVRVSSILGLVIS